MEYNVIVYRLHKTVKPPDILTALTDLMQSFSVQYQKCLFRAISLILECELDGAPRSKRKTHAVARICKAYPQVKDSLHQTKRDKGGGLVEEELSISNFSETDFSETGEWEPSVIFEIAGKIPRTYQPNHLKLLLDGLTFSKSAQPVPAIAPPEGGEGLPLGQYILYERDSYGAEKHAYLYFSAEASAMEDMRQLFFEFARTVPGQYVETQVKKSE